MRSDRTKFRQLAAEWDDGEGPMRQIPAREPAFDERGPHDRFNGARFVRRPGREAIGFHVTMRLEDDRPIATTPAALRTVARVALAQGETRGLVAFGAADNHLHAELLTDRASAGAFARYVETALRWQLGLAARFEHARIRPLRDQRHAYATFHYVHRQDARHALDLDRWREGTSVPDLLGLRVVKTSLIARVRVHLPRVRREELVAQLPATGAAQLSAELGAPQPPAGLGGPQPWAARGSARVPTSPIDADVALDLDVLADAAASAFALPNLHGLAPDAARARRAAVHAAGDTVTSQRVGESLGLTVRAVQALRRLPCEALAVRAVMLQARLRAIVQTPARP